MTKKKKKSWLKNRVSNLRLLSWYWKLIISLFIVFVGGSWGFSLITVADDILMVLGYFILAFLLWVVIQIWLPNKTEK